MPNMSRMRRIVALSLVGVLATCFAQSEVGATSYPLLHTTLYLHGETPAGELEFPDDLVNQTWQSMDPSKPKESLPRSKGLGWSNTRCAGSRFFPVWVGNVTGTIVGSIKVTFTSVSNPQEVDVRLWRTNQQLCNADYPSPMRHKTVSLPAGQGEVTVVLPPGRFQVAGALMVQISPTMINNTDTPGGGRILYDSAGTLSRVEFDCLPVEDAGSCTK